MIEVCIPVYQRPHRIPKLIKEFKNQTTDNFRLNFWNNTRKPLDIKGFPKERIQVIDLNKNVGSQAHFLLVPKTTGNPIIFLDDDESIAPDFVEYNYKQYLKFGKNCILGWWIRIFNRGKYNLAIRKCPYGAEVDFIGTGGMILDRGIFDREPILQNIPKPFAKVEDLYLCYLARMKYKMKLIRILPKCKIIADGKDQFKDIDKQAIFIILCKRGWRLIKDAHS